MTGIRIPIDAETLRRKYQDERLPVLQIARDMHIAVSTVRKRLGELDIRRPRTISILSSGDTHCPTCGKSAMRFREEYKQRRTATK